MKALPNEIQRIAINEILIHNGPNDYRVSNQVWAFREEGGEWQLVADRLQQQYTLIGTLCSTRAIAAECGEFVCQGVKTKAEDYLGLWREAVKAPISNAELMRRGGSLTATFKRKQTAFESAVRQYAKLELLQLLNRDDCVIEDDKVTWTIALTTMDALRAYEDINSIYCDTSEDGDDVQGYTLSLKLPATVARTQGAMANAHVNTPVRTHAQFELEM